MAASALVLRLLPALLAAVLGAPHLADGARLLSAEKRKPAWVGKNSAASSDPSPAELRARIAKLKRTLAKYKKKPEVTSESLKATNPACSPGFPVLEKHSEAWHGDVCRTKPDANGDFQVDWTCPTMCSATKGTGQDSPWCVMTNDPASPCRSGGVASCICEADNAAWYAPPPTDPPKCVFIDLGAANGNSYQAFLAGKIGKLPESSGFSPKDCEAYLVEANPIFNSALDQVSHDVNPGKVHALASTAAYMCEKTVDFFVDSKTASADGTSQYWGSSMSTKHPDVANSGFREVRVPTVNLIRMLKEHAVAKDYVIVKMDIEGAEWDVLPCLSGSPAAGLMDQLLVEKHSQSWGLEGHTEEHWTASVKELRAKGVDVPDYFSKTFL